MAMGSHGDMDGLRRARGMSRRRCSEIDPFSPAWGRQLGSGGDPGETAQGQLELDHHVVYAQFGSDSSGNRKPEIRMLDPKEKAKSPALITVSMTWL